MAASPMLSADDFRPDDDGPKLFFSGCGELSIGPQGCTLLVADNGLVVAPDELFSFVPGEHVFMQGTIEDGISPCFPAEIPGLAVDVASLCLDRCGELVLVADDCVFLVADDGLQVFLGDAQGFEIGSRVHAAGGQVFDFFCTGLGTHAGMIDPVITAAAGDLTCDDAVGPADLAQLLATWGSCPKLAPCPGDFDNDGEIGPADLAELLANWGSARG
jgi:hypothetical protein